jgi:hypothetical protein
MIRARAVDHLGQPEHQRGRARGAGFGTAYHALERLDGAKMLVLAAMAVALSAVAISAPILPRWPAPIGFLLWAGLAKGPVTSCAAPGCRLGQCDR